VILAPYAKVPLLYSLLRAANALLVPVAAARPKGGGSGGEKKEAAAAAAPAAGAEAPKKRTNAVRDAITAHKGSFKSGDVPICILPEGTCTNGRSIVKFFSGAFEGGTPVQPITIQYPFDYYNGGAFLTTLPAHLLKVFLNPWMTVDAAFLPLYSPDAAEAADGDLMAENVRKAMGAASAVPLSPLGAKELREFLAQGSKEGKAT
jgi:1-acyl-sn-glycerol-3-phosphate acyltransferase